MFHKLFTLGAILVIVMTFVLRSMCSSWNQCMDNFEQVFATDPNITTVVSSLDVGYTPSVDCSQGATDCKIAYRDNTNAELKFVDCGDATCTNGNATISTVDSDGDVGYNPSLDCSGGATDCKIAYYDNFNQDLKFVDCGDAACTSANATITTLDSTGSVGQTPSLDCSDGPTNCKIAYYDSTNQDLKFVDCGDASCSSGAATFTTVDSTGNVGQNPSIDCAPGGVADPDGCRIAYIDATNVDLKFVTCGDEACTSGNATFTTPDTTIIVIANPSLDCSAGATDCKIAYQNQYLTFADCGDATCTSGSATISTVDTSNSFGFYTSLDCSAGATNCKISYYDGSNADLKFAACGDAACTSTNVILNTLDSTGTVGNPSSMDCSQGATDCKIAYFYDSGNDLKFADCEDAYCGGSPPEECGNGAIEGSEECDDGDTSSGDGCSSSCTEESGWSCTGEPSSCSTTCGDSIVAGAEECDPATTGSASAQCTDQDLRTCNSSCVCVAECGNGEIEGSEECDDDNTSNGDGCSSTCTEESGWSCSGEPSSCSTTCGDSIVAGAEECDPATTGSASAQCVDEDLRTCNASCACVAECGNGQVEGSEECDDDNTSNGDGCSSTCTEESGYTCTGEPSSCSTVCGDSIVAGAEECDPATPAATSATCTDGDKRTCDSNCTCVAYCGNAATEGTEECDDGNSDNKDSCSTSCKNISGPSGYCGNGVKDAGLGETCDDGNTQNGDGCSSTCTIEGSSSSSIGNTSSSVTSFQQSVGSLSSSTSTSSSTNSQSGKSFLNFNLQTYCCMNPNAKNVDVICPAALGLFNINATCLFGYGSQSTCVRECTSPTTTVKNMDANPNVDRKQTSPIQTYCCTNPGAEEPEDRCSSTFGVMNFNTTCIIGFPNQNACIHNCR